MQTTSYEHGLSRIDLNLNHRLKSKSMRLKPQNPMEWKWPIIEMTNFHRWFLDECKEWSSGEIISLTSAISPTWWHGFYLWRMTLWPWHRCLEIDFYHCRGLNLLFTLRCQGQEKCLWPRIFNHVFICLCTLEWKKKRLKRSAFHLEIALQNMTIWSK